MSLEHLHSLFLRGMLEAVSDSPVSLKAPSMHVSAQI